MKIIKSCIDKIDAFNSANEEGNLLPVGSKFMNGKISHNFAGLDGTNVVYEHVGTEKDCFFEVGYEICFYDSNGNTSIVYHFLYDYKKCFQFLCRCCWGELSFKNNPTIWLDGKPFCRYEMTEVE